MMKPVELILAIGRVTLLLATPGSVIVAQEEAQTCGPTARTIAGGQLTHTQAGALSGCRRTGPATLAKLWLKPDPEARNLERLAEASSVLRDSRLFIAALAASENESAPTASRIAALRVLASYYSSELWPSTTYLSSGSLGDPIPVTMDKNAKDGSSPLRPGSRSEIHKTLIHLSRNTPDQEVSHAAAMLRQGLAFVDPSNTPVVANSIVLTAGCGPRVTLESRADINLDLRVRVLETNYDQKFVLRGGQTGGKGRVVLAPPVGTVVVTFGNKEVARLSNRSARCAPGLTRH